MKPTTYVVLLTLIIAFMIAKQMLPGGEQLPMEDGISSATALPADRAAAKVAYQTVTFGLG